MSGSRLKQQFDTLYRHFEGNDAQVTVSDLVDVLHCTRRNVRMVMGKLHEEGWVRWEPAVGRGKLSSLIFLQTREALINADVIAHLQQGEFDRALHLLNGDINQLSVVITEQLGYATVEGRQILRLPYYRALGKLNPLYPMRRSEHHLARQLYNGLTKIDGEKGEIVGDLAHQWRMITPTCWHFFVRPGVFFHHGKRVTAIDYVESLRRLTSLRLFRHIADVSSPFPQVIEIQLSEQDYHLPELLASIQAVILPQEDLALSPDETPRGTGPFMISQADSQRLKLSAFERYFGLRALLDDIEIWVIDSISACQLHAESSQEANSQPQVGLQRLDQGCAYLVLNQTTGIAASEAWQHYFVNCIRPLDILQHLQGKTEPHFKAIPAYGFLPGWNNPITVEPVSQPPQRDARVTLAYADSHPVFATVAQTIKATLLKHGVECDVCKMSFDEFHRDEHSTADLWLGGVNMGTRHPVSLLNWAVNHAVLSRAMTPAHWQHFEDSIGNWRTSVSDVAPAQTMLAECVDRRILLPLFHMWAGVSFSNHLKGAETNELGWFDFTTVWVDASQSD